MNQLLIDVKDTLTDDVKAKLLLLTEEDGGYEVLYPNSFDGRLRKVCTIILDGKDYIIEGDSIYKRQFITEEREDE